MSPQSSSITTINANHGGGVSGGGVVGGRNVRATTISHLRGEIPPPPSGANSTGSSNEKAAVVKEGMLLKRSNRGAKWNERYFTLVGNQLSYYHKKGDTDVKATFKISNEMGGCHVSSLYIDQRQKGTSKEVLYCFRVAFDQKDGDNLSHADESLGTAPHDKHNHDHPTLPPAMPREDDDIFHSSEMQMDDESLVTPHKQPKIQTPFRRSHKPNPQQIHAGSHVRNRDLATPTNDREMVTAPATPPKRGHKLKASLKLGKSKKKAQQQDTTPTRDVAIPELNGTRKSPAPGEDRKTYLREKKKEEQQLMHNRYEENKKEKKLKNRKKLTEGSKIAVATGAAVTVGVLTAGLGLLAGLIFIGAGAAAGGTGVVGGAAYKRTKKRTGEIILATSSYEAARKWKSALDACLVSERVRDSTWGQLFVMDGRNATTALLPTEVMFRGTANGGGDDNLAVPEIQRTGTFTLPEDQPKFVQPGAAWKPLQAGWATTFGTNLQGLRIFQEERRNDGPCTPLKAQVILNASPLHAFLCLMSLARIPSTNKSAVPQPNSGQRASFRVIERVDDHMDIIHLVFRPLYLFPSWTAPRDFVLFRYWRYEPDGTYVICFDSVKHNNCPPMPGYTRGDMHGVYMIASRKKDTSSSGFIPQECLLTSIVQVDPKGWVPLRPIPPLAHQGYGEAFTVSSLLQLLDIKDALDCERFVPTALGSSGNPAHSAIVRDFGMLPPSPTYERRASDAEDSNGQGSAQEDDPFSYDFTYATNEATESTIVLQQQGIATQPKPFPVHKWAQPDANSFRVRGKTYKMDKIKINAGSSIGRLFAVDVVRVDSTLYSGFSMHPTERIQLGLEREKQLKAKGLSSDMPPFIFVVNICLPGPPFYHGVFYYAIDDRSTIDGTDGTPSSKLCNQFFFGDSDTFRDNTFKLIPQIVEGNFMVRKAVGSTPAIMGTKLRQTYVQNDRFFEVILDCGSSSVATGVIRLSLSYAKTLVVDMGFLFEGNDETTLPERIFGCVRMKYTEFGTHLRKVEHPPQEEEEKEEEEVQ